MSVEVKGLPDNATESSIELYFENTRRSGGGNVEKVLLNQAKKSALVFFENAAVVEKVLGKKHTIDNKQVQVTAYEEETQQDETNVMESSCTVEVRGFKRETSDDELLELYFENSRRSGGGPVVQCSRKDDVLYITFESSEVAERVSKQKHEVDKRQLDVKLHIPKPCYTNRFLVSNLNSTTTKESLQNFLEARCHCEITDTIYGEIPGVALVSFKEDEILDLSSLQEDCKTKKKLEGNHIELSTVPIADSIVVHGLHPETSTETVNLYFEGSRSGNNEETDVTVTNYPDKGYCLVQFENHRVVDAVLSKRRHEIEGRVLTLSLYIENLGIRMADGEQSWYKQPEAFTLEFLDKNKCTYLQQIKDRNLQDEMQKCYAEITWLSEDSATVKCTLTKETANAVKKARTWREDTEKCFKFYLDKLVVERVQTLSDIWNDVSTKLNDIRISTEVKMSMSQSEHEVVIVGYPESVDKILREVKAVVTGVTDEFIRKKEEVTETVTTVKTLQLRLLLASGFHTKAMKKYDHMTVTIKLETNDIIFKGQVKHVNSCKLDMYEQINTFVAREETGVSKAKLSVLNQREVKDILVTKMKGKNLCGVWETDVSKLSILSISDQSAEEVIQLINNTIAEHTEHLSPESYFLLDSEKWRRLQQDLSAQSENLACISTNSDKSITIVATANIFDGIKVKIQTFISENTVYNKVLKIPKPVYKFLLLHMESDIQSIAHHIAQYNGKIEYKRDLPKIIVYGCKEGLDEAVNTLKDIAEKVQNRKHTMKKDGIGKYIHSERIKGIITDTERTERCVIELTFDESEKITIEGVSPDPIGHSGTGQYASCLISSQRRIDVLKADMTTLRVDIIVNAANDRLDHVGGLAKAIADKGGPSIQRESNEYKAKHKNLRAGEAVSTGAGRLPCKMVVHAVGPVWSGGRQGEARDLKAAIKACLDQADEKGYKSIAFPALSAGIFGYPVELATKHIVEAINSYFSQNNPACSVTNVNLVDVGEKTVTAFAAALEDVYYDRTVSTSKTMMESGTSASNTLQQNKRQHCDFGSENPNYSANGSLEIKLIKGEIAKQTVDVIVNTTSNNLDLTNGTVSKTILKEGGQSLQAELRSRYPQGVKSGEFVIGSNGNLRCKAVYHTCLKKWSDEGTLVLKVLVMKCLEKASSAGYSSIAFPALGTGALGYPRDIVAKTMHSVVEDFSDRNGSLREVRIVVYPADRKTVEAFERQKDHISGTPYNIELKKGQINTEKVDVIVNSTSTNLDLNTGGVSRALLARGGDDIQKDLRKKYPRGLKPMEIAVTSGGKLLCREIYHCCLPSWTDKKNIRDLQTLIEKCLKQASGSDYKSIAFPALGTGKLGYPKEVVAQTMYSVMDGFQRHNKSLKKVTIVTYPKDDSTTAVFEKHEKLRADGIKTTLLPEHFQGEPIRDKGTSSDNMNIGNICVVVTSGNLVKDDADCIVNSTNVELDLRKGAVSSAIAKECGASMESQCAKKADQMRQKGVISTTAIDLKCKYVIHVAGDHFGNDWKFVIKACLHEARSLGDVKSVAFPILGTGSGHATPQQMAEIMATTISVFESQAGNIDEVRVVIFQQKMLAPFDNQIRASVAAIGKSWPTSYIYRGSLSQGSVNVFVFSDDDKHIDTGIQKLEKRCDNELWTKTVTDKVIAKLSDEQIKVLKKQFEVDLVIDRKSCKVKITGFADQVGNAMTEVTSYLWKIEKEEVESERAALLSRSVQWSYFEKDANGQNKLHDFDTKTNAEIERSYEGKKKQIKVKIPSGKLEIGLSSLTGTLEKTKDSINVIRRDLFKEAAASMFDPPDYWSAMPDDVNFQQHDVPTNGTEFNDVAQLFMATVGVQTAKVINVKRLQNRSLYQQYTAKKKQLEKQNPPNTQNERRLWHGTSADTIDSINIHGYNRSYCGKNATAYGQGVYFAVNAKYSASNTYSRPDSNGHKYMYLAKVLTGVYTKGDHSMRTPPPKPSGNGPNDLCDSVVNDVSSPIMFIVFNDTMAYPDYLVTFTI